MRKIIITISFFNILIAAAQESKYRYDDATQLWRLTDNAAGLQLDSSRNRGYAEFNAEHRSGDYHRVQEGSQRNLFHFETERYQSVGKYLVGYGRFSFDMDRTKNRAWADVYRPYGATPYFSGSPVAGKYDQQSFDFTGALGTVPLLCKSSFGDSNGGLRFGLRLDYKAGDLSRLRDPRSRSELLDYKLTPSVAFTVGRHTLGFAPYYNRRKEKIPNLTTVQTDPYLSYYEMRGLEQVSGSIGAYKGFGRQWVDHRFGGSLSYGFRDKQLNSLTTIGVEGGREEALEDEKRMPGRYTSYRYTLASHHRIYGSSLLHEADLTMSYDEGYGDEYTQQRVQTTDATTGVSSYHYETLIAYNKRYQTHSVSGQAHYRLNFLCQQQPVGYAGVNFAVESCHQKHILPTSTFDHQRLALVAEGGKSLLAGRLWIDLSCGYHFTDTDDDDLVLAEPGSVYAQEVLLPDMAYYKANYWQGHIELKYQFPLTLKGTSTQWYVKAYGDYLRTQHCQMDMKVVGLSIGLYN